MFRQVPQRSAVVAGMQRLFGHGVLSGAGVAAVCGGDQERGEHGLEAMDERVGFLVALEERLDLRILHGYLAGLPYPAMGSQPQRCRAELRSVS